MAKEKLDERWSKMINSEEKSMFKPGNTPYTKFGNELLNGDIAWDEVVQDILDTGYDKSELALEVGLKKAIINQVAAGEFEGIYFRAGARMLTIHCRLFPGKYGF